MSDSDADIPSAAVISDGIRDVVISIHRSGNDDDLTVNRVRTGAEQKLGLPAGFLRSDEWKNKSKSMIKEAVDKYCGDEPAPVPSPKKASKAQPKAKPEPKKKTNSTKESAPRGIKRKAAAPTKKPQKRRKTASSEEESDAAMSDSPALSDQPSDVERKPAKQPARRQKKVVAEDSDEEDGTPQKAQHKKEDQSAKGNEAQAVLSDKNFERPATPSPPAKDDDAESDLSSVIDESPVKKRRRPAEKPAKAAKGAKVEPKAAKAEDAPDQAEIKRLQSWLVKCGIRKVWGKELAKCETPKDKIRHLKGMLKDAGMDGKYSVEKAARIKEQREFAKDLEEIQAGAAAWGETTSTGRPRRAAARQVQPVALPDDSDDDDEEDKAQDAKDDMTNDSDDDDDDEVQGDSGSDDSVGGKDDEDDNDSD